MLLLLTFLSSFCLAQQQILQPATDTYTPLNDALARKVNKTLEYFHIPGLSLSIVNGSEIYAAGYGLASFPSTLAGPETLYYGGSTTKAFTAAAVSLLVDEGIVTWKTRISDLIRDDFVLSDEYATTHITLEDALSHRTGLPRHDMSVGKPNTTLRDTVRNLRYLPLTAEPRTRYQYCNLMFMTVGYVIQQLTSQWLGDFLRTQIWEPLGMTGTFFSREDAIASPYEFAHGYAWNNVTSEYVMIPWSPTVYAGAGAVISNVVDYGKWLRMMIHRATPLSRSGHEALMTPRSIIVPGTPGVRPGTLTGDAVYSLGWWRYTYRGQLVVTHGGSIDGFGSLVLYLPDLKWGVTIMANTQGSSDYAASTLAYYLMDEILDVPEEERYDWLKAFDKDNEEIERFLSDAKRRLYPSLPTPPISHSLPLESYTGVYSNPAFAFFKVGIHDERLRGEVQSEWLDFDADMEHISGEHWLASAKQSTTNYTLVTRVEFKVNIEGKVTEAGIELDAELAAIGQKTWFRKGA